MGTWCLLAKRELETASRIFESSSCAFKICILTCCWLSRIVTWPLIGSCQYLHFFARCRWWWATRDKLRGVDILSCTTTFIADICETLDKMLAMRYVQDARWNLALCRHLILIVTKRHCWSLLYLFCPDRLVMLWLKVEGRLWSIQAVWAPLDLTAWFFDVVCDGSTVPWMCQLLVCHSVRLTMLWWSVDLAVASDSCTLALFLGKVWIWGLNFQLFWRVIIAAAFNLCTLLASLWLFWWLLLSYLRTRFS